MMFAFCFQVPIWLPSSTIGAKSQGFVTLQPFRVYPWQAYVHPGDGLWPMPGVQLVVTPPTALSWRELHVTHSAVSSNSIYMVRDTTLGAWQKVYQSFCLPYMAERALLFQVVFHPITCSTASLWWTLNLVMGYQFDEFTHMWLAEHFITQSQIFQGFTGKLPTLTQFPLKQVCEDYSLLGPGSW